MKDDTNRIKTLEKQALKFNCFREYLSQPDLVLLTWSSRFKQKHSLFRQMWDISVKVKFGGYDEGLCASLLSAGLYNASDNMNKCFSTWAT